MCSYRLSVETSQVSRLLAFDNILSFEPISKLLKEQNKTLLLFVPLFELIGKSTSAYHCCLYSHCL